MKDILSGIFYALTLGVIIIVMFIIPIPIKEFRDQIQRLREQVSELQKKAGTND